MAFVKPTPIIGNVELGFKDLSSVEGWFVPYPTFEVYFLGTVL